MSDPTEPQGVRARAVKRLRQKRDLATHAVVYLLVNGVLVVIWSLTSDGFFWPVFPIAFWGIGLAMNAWTVWRGEEFTEAQVDREVARLERRDHPHDTDLR
jgi:hypothetical protein